MTADELVEEVLFPAFNDHPRVSAVDEAMAGLGVDAVVLDVTMDDGSEWQITVARPTTYRADG